MSFLATSGKSFAKETREEQFLRHFRDTGTAKAFQNALILLYRIPIKPANLIEFFAEYFENGAQDLVKLSLLKAELCYKHAETQDMHKRIQKLERELLQYEPKASESQFNMESKQRFSVIAEDTEQTQEHEYDMFDRFFGDLDEIGHENFPPSAQPSLMSMSVLNEEQPQPEHQDRRNSSKYDESLDSKDTEPVNEIVDEKSDVKCVEERESQVILQDIKTMDPWGIIFNFQPHKEEEPKAEAKFKEEKPRKKSLSKNVPMSPSEMSVIGSVSSLDSERNYKNYDSDDAETLAEMYHGLALDAAREAAEQMNEVKKDEVGKLLSVQKAPKVSIGDWLGWSLPSSSTMLVEEEQERKERQARGRTDLGGGPSEVTTNLGDPSISTFELFKTPQEPTVRPQHWSHFIDPLVEDDMETCEIEAERNIFWLDSPRGVVNPIVDPMDDSYLLQERMAQIAKKMQRADDDSGGFIYEFTQQMESQRFENDDKITNICAQACHVRNRKTVITKVDKQVMTDYDACLCEDCQCDTGDEDGHSISRYGRIVPGKMTNWTKRLSELSPNDDPEDFDCYLETPGEDYDLLGEDDNIICYKKKKSVDAGAEKEVPIEERSLHLLEDFTIPLTSIQSSCQCSDTSFNDLSGAKEECMSTCISSKRGQRESQILHFKKSVRKSQDANTMTMSEIKRKQEIENDRRYSVDPNLADVFKSPNPYGAAPEQDGKGQGDKAKRGSLTDGKNKRKSLRAQGDGNEKYISDAYELDLDKEVKKKFGI